MSTPSKPARASIYRVTNEARQQRILRAIQRVSDPAITALGTSADDEFFIVAECTSATADMHVRRIVVSLDLSATRVTGSERLYDETAPTSSYLPGLGLPRVVLDGVRKLI